ncbi:hypothetical protein D3C79_980010 [compost metagenome]
MVAHVNAARDDLATHAKREISLHTRLHITGQGDPGGEVSGLDLQYTDPWQNLGSLFLAATCEQAKQPQAYDQQ